MKTNFFLGLLAGVICVPALAGAQANVIYEQTFDSAASSADFEAPVVTANPATQNPATSVDFGFDYSTLIRPSSVLTGAEGNTPVPEAPRTPVGTAATRGLAIQVNTDSDAGALAATTLNLFSTASYSGNYEVEVDAYYFWDGNSGSTEDVLVGAGHSGAATGVLRSALPFGADTADGIMYKHFGDADVGGPDHYFILGADPIDYVDQPGTTWGTTGGEDVPGRDWNSANDAEFNALIEAAMPGPYRPGTLTHTWATILIRYQNGIARLFINDTFIASVPITGDLDGKLMLGHEDSFQGVNAGNVMLFDNLVVREIVGPTANESWPVYE